MEKYKKTVLACYLGFAYQGIVNNLPPILFLIFQKTWNVSLMQITFLITLGFLTSFLMCALSILYIEKVSYRTVAVISSISAFIGMVSLVFLPHFMSNPYLGLCIATFFNGLGGGLIDIVGSPIIEALPSDNKSASMNMLHSMYCWASVAVIVITTITLKIFGENSWKLLTLIYAIIPLLCIILFIKVPMLRLVEKKGTHTPLKTILKHKYFYIFLLLILISGASEQAISQWSSYFAEIGLAVPKIIGDILGPAFLLLTMAISRTIIGVSRKKFKLKKLLLLSSIICLMSVLIIIFSPVPIGSLLAIGFCGFGIGIFWPTTLSLSREFFPKADATMFAFITLAGSFGCILGPSLIGFISKKIESNEWKSILSNFLNIEGPELAFKTGMLTIVILQMIMIFALLYIKKGRKLS